MRKLWKRLLCTCLGVMSSNIKGPKVFIYQLPSIICWWLPIMVYNSLALLEFCPQEKAVHVARWKSARTHWSRMAPLGQPRLWEVLLHTHFHHCYYIYNFHVLFCLSFCICILVLVLRLNIHKTNASFFFLHNLLSCFFFCLCLCSRNSLSKYSLHWYSLSSYIIKNICLFLVFLVQFVQDNFGSQFG